MKMKLDSCEVCMQMTNHGCLKCASKQSRLSAIEEAIGVVKDYEDYLISRDEVIEALEALKKEKV